MVLQVPGPSKVTDVVEPDALQYHDKGAAAETQKTCWVCAHEGELYEEAFIGLGSPAIETKADGEFRNMSTVRFEKCAKRSGQLLKSVNAWNRANPDRQIKLVSVGGPHEYFVGGNLLKGSGDAFGDDFSVCSFNPGADAKHFSEAQLRESIAKEYERTLQMDRMKTKCERHVEAQKVEHDKQLRDLQTKYEVQMIKQKGEADMKYGLAQAEIQRLKDDLKKVAKEMPSAGSKRKRTTQGGREEDEYVEPPAEEIDGYNSYDIRRLLREAYATQKRMLHLEGMYKRSEERNKDMLKEMESNNIQTKIVKGNNFKLTADLTKANAELAVLRAAAAPAVVVEPKPAGLPPSRFQPSRYQKTPGSDGDTVIVRAQDVSKSVGMSWPMKQFVCQSCDINQRRVDDLFREFEAGGKRELALKHEKIDWEEKANAATNRAFELEHQLGDIKCILCLCGHCRGKVKEWEAEREATFREANMEMMAME